MKILTNVFKMDVFLKRIPKILIWTAFLSKIHLIFSFLVLRKVSGGAGSTPLFGLYGYVPLDRVGFFGLAVLNRVYNSTCLCPKQGMVLRAERL